MERLDGRPGIGVANNGRGDTARIAGVTSITALDRVDHGRVGDIGVVDLVTNIITVISPSLATRAVEASLGGRTVRSGESDCVGGGLPSITAAVVCRTVIDAGLSYSLGDGLPVSGLGGPASTNLCSSGARGVPIFTSVTTVDNNDGDIVVLVYGQVTSVMIVC